MDKFKGTPGPWRWEVNLGSKNISLCGGETRYDLTVMDFVRYGTGSAAPRFIAEPSSGFQIMERADKLSKIVPGREHHARWFQTLSHPDAQLIAAAPDLLEAIQLLVHYHMCEQEGIGSGQPTALEWLAAVDKAGDAINKAIGRE